MDVTAEDHQVRLGLPRGPSLCKTCTTSFFSRFSRHRGLQGQFGGSMINDQKGNRSGNGERISREQFDAERKVR